MAPATFEANKVNDCPAHTGELLDAVGEGADALTLIVMLADTELQPFTVAITEYKPASAVVMLILLGFCCVEVKLFGPDQL